MRAIVVSQFGPPEVLVPADVPDPVPADGQVLVAVELADVTFVETQIRAGRPPSPAMTPSLPYIPGNGVAGTIGDRRVLTQTGGTGGYAEQVAVAEAGLIDVPAGLSLPDALALLADGRTAGLLVAEAAIAPGETVLVPAAAGGVGSLLVQLARAAGARVVAAAGGERKVAVAREQLGADVALDYTRAGWADAVGPVDVAFDGVGGAIGREAFATVRSGGRYLPFGAASGAFAGVSAEEAAERGVAIVRGGPPGAEEAARLVGAALDAAAGGTLRPIVGQMVALDRAADAHRAIEARETIGKTLLDVR
jgi:NADPH2:quinone reductase